jgi:hypothetical protein
VRSVLAGLRTLVVPWGAPPGSPAIILGPDIPAELQAFYGGTVVAAQLWRLSAGNYQYRAVLSAGPIVVEGLAINVPPITITETVRWASGGGNALITYNNAGAVTTHQYASPTLVQFLGTVQMPPAASITSGGAPAATAWLLTKLAIAQCSANLTLATGAAVAVTGATFTITRSGGTPNAVLNQPVLWVILATVDIQWTAAGATVAIAELYQDGVNLGTTAIMGSGDAASTPRGMGVQVYSGVFTPTLGTPSTTLELRGNKSIAAGTVRINQTNTQLLVALFT